MPMNREELALHVQSQLVRVDKPLSEKQIHKFYDNVEGENALSTHLEQCNQTLPALLSSSTELFTKNGDKWTAMPTSRFDTILGANRERGKTGNLSGTNKELALHVQSQLVRLGKPLSVEQIVKHYDIVEGTGALATHLQKAHTTLPALLSSETELFIKNGNKWTAAPTHRFDSVLSARY